MKLFSMQGQLGERKEELEKSPQKFWIRPGRTTTWWYFVRDIVVDEWKENFRMSRENFYKLCNELCAFIEQKTTVMIILLIKRGKWQVAVAMYDEGRMRKTANAFGLSRACVSLTIRSSFSNHSPKLSWTPIY